MAEIAGLVLGGIPLVISAVEHYEECFRILGCMREFKLEYRKCQNRVRNFKLQYDLTLDKLFLDVVDSQEELERLKCCSDDQGWLEVEERLKERLLPKVYQSYLDTMRDMQETVHDLGEELGVDKTAFQERMSQGKVTVPAGLVPQSGSGKQWPAKMSTMAKRSQGRVSYEAQRLKFSQGKTRRDDLFDQIEAYRETLDRLMFKNDDVAKMLRSSQRPTLMHRGLLEFWRHARNIYSLLLLSWKCQCHAEHCADLRLMHREVANVRFEICFRSDASSANSSRAPWVSHKVVVEESKGLRLRDLPSATPTPTPVAGPKVPLGSSQQATGAKKPMPIKSALKKSSKKSHIANAGVVSVPSISFASSPSSASTHNSRKANDSINTQRDAVATPMILPEIDDLCHAISAHIDQQPCSGLLTAGGIDKEYSLMSPTTTSRSANAETTTLTNLLSDTATTPKRVHRYNIALAIASSHLQLHSSHWLGHQWNGDNILFDINNGSVAIDQPHLRTGFTQHNPLSGKASTVDESFMTLGILLLELCFGTTLENSPFRNRYRSPDGQQDSVMDLAAAMKWAENVEGEAGPEYADAVYWCLGIRRLNQNCNAWRQDLLKTVIEPLKSSYQKLI